MKEITISISNQLLFDRLHILALEYSVSPELLIHVALKRLIDDIEFIRNLRAGKAKLE